MLNFPFCKDCKKRLGDYRSTFCQSCSQKSKNNPNRKWRVNSGCFKKGLTPWNKGLRGLKPWNKGLIKETDSRLDYFRPTEFKDQGRCDENMKLRKSRESLIWRVSVFERDNYICQNCGAKGGKLHADHIKPWSLYPELRFAIDNGKTLCVECHKQTETYGGRILRFKRKESISIC